MGNSLQPPSISLSSIKSGPPNLDNLPPEIYHYYLFKYVDINDLFELKLVTKSLYFAVNDYKITELSFLSDITFIDFYVNYQDYWLPNRPFGNRLNTSKLTILKNPSAILLNLKFLKIKQFLVPIPFSLKDFNKFTKLQVLYILQGGNFFA